MNGVRSVGEIEPESPQLFACVAVIPNQWRMVSLRSFSTSAIRTSAPTAIVGQIRSRPANQRLRMLAFQTQSHRLAAGRLEHHAARTLHLERPGRFRFVAGSMWQSSKAKRLTAKARAINARLRTELSAARLQLQVQSEIIAAYRDALAAIQSRDNLSTAINQTDLRTLKGRG